MKKESKPLFKSKFIEEIYEVWPLFIIIISLLFLAIGIFVYYIIRNDLNDPIICYMPVLICTAIFLTAKFIRMNREYYEEFNKSVNFWSNIVIIIGFLMVFFVIFGTLYLMVVSFYVY